MRNLRKRIGDDIRLRPVLLYLATMRLGIYKPASDIYYFPRWDFKSVFCSGFMLYRFKKALGKDAGAIGRMLKSVVRGKFVKPSTNYGCAAGRLHKGRPILTDFTYMIPVHASCDPHSLSNLVLCHASVPFDPWLAFRTKKNGDIVLN